MRLPELIIGKLKAKVPIIQGGMGIGVSLHKLASAVANAGGIGVISAAQVGFLEKDFLINNLKANLRALKKEITMARDLSPKGILGVNLMVASTNYQEYVKVCIEENIDIIISGAGLPLDLPKLTKGSNIKIAPIVSSAKACNLICKSWDRKHKASPDLVIIEGPKAGGHLGFHKEDLKNPPILKDIIMEVKKIIKTYEERYKKNIPVIVGGGIFTGHDISNAISYGANGVQMGTRFVATDECDANINFKKAYVNAKREDITIVQSPVGMPGRAIKNKFIETIASSNSKIHCLYNCLKPCNPQNVPYCISKALINAVKGNLDEGLIFAGTNVDKIKNITSVKNLINELVIEAKNDLN